MLSLTAPHFNKGEMMAQKVMSRKEFLREAFSLFKKTFGEEDIASSQTISAGILLPPGAVSIEHYLNHCNQCYACVAKCPHEAIRVHRDERSQLAGFPVIEPRLQPCYLCEDFPCINTCDVNALQSDAEYRRLGTAILMKERCLISAGHICMSCINACPEIGKAIRRDTDGYPVVSSEFCTGCGICENSCPADPAAIRVISKQKSGD
ncbi:MAG: hypothetical protein D6732_26450 [Methanobacteriota archaeon]|nr:MAG: hypothetical protein D6732_26450 [Euryarchaeota archaeon]